MGRQGHHGRRPFPVASDRAALMSVVRGRKIEGLRVRRANALLLLDDGRSASFAAEVLFLDPDTVRGWRRDFAERGPASVELSAYPAREGHLTAAQEAKARERFRAHPPRDTNEVRAWLLEAFGVEYSRPGAIKLMHRLGFEWVKPERLPKQADREAQEAFIKSYESLMNGLRPDEKVVFADAVHPEHQSRPAHGWFHKGDRPAVQATTGRQRMNIHGALDLEEMRLVRVEGERINAETTLALFRRVESAWPEARTVHVFLDNARYHHAKMLKPWLERPECRLKLHFLPPAPRTSTRSSASGGSCTST